MFERVISCATPVFFLLIAIELVVAWRRGHRTYRVADAVNSISIGAISTFSGVFTRAMRLGIYVWIYEVARLTTLDAGSPWVWLFALVSYDFLYYWYHRLGHEVNVLWAAHVVHHQSEEFNLSTALRQTSSGFLLSWLFYVPMALAGIPPVLFAAVALTDLLYQYWIHTELVGSLGWFDRVFASPSNHRVHHATNDRYIDRNYGGILIVWDRLFGTFQPELAGEPCVYGTRAPLRSWDPVWANLDTYAKLAREAWRARRWRDKLGIWWQRPGWRPADLAAAEPVAPFTLADFRKFDPPAPPWLLGYAAVQAAIAILLGMHFLQLAGTAAAATLLPYFGWLLASLWIAGGLTQARRGFLLLEAARVTTTLAGCVITGSWFGGVALGRAACLACT